ncbi:acetyltransferase [Colletotrichum tofieldiae]|nr:acetyltransferase [Colletotrichum tofieldiae]
MGKMRLREGGTLPHDDTFIVEAFDSTISYLEEIGSGQMWGSQPFSEKEGFVEETAKDVRTSEKYRTTGEGDALRVFLAEVVVEPSAMPLSNSTTQPPGPRYWAADDGTRMISVGRCSSARIGYLNMSSLSFTSMLSAPSWRETRGSGEALVRKAKDYGLEKGMKALYVDAWAGNGRRLVEFYEKQGFSIVSDFEMKRANGTIWQGTLLRAELEGLKRDIDSKGNEE